MRVYASEFNQLPHFPCENIVERLKILQNFFYIILIIGLRNFPILYTFYGVRSSIWFSAGGFGSIDVDDKICKQFPSYSCEINFNFNFYMNIGISAMKTEKLSSRVYICYKTLIHIFSRLDVFIQIAVLYKK